MADFSTDSDPSDKYEGPGTPERLHEGMDIGFILKFPFEDSGWVKKVLIMGAINLIPIVGQLNLLGWMHAAFRLKNEDVRELPDAGFGFIGDGVKVAIAVLPVIVFSFLAALPLPGIVTSLLGLLTLGASLLSPAFLYLHMQEDEAMPWLKVNDLKRVILEPGVVPYVMLWLTFLIAGCLAGLGSIACGVGAAFTSVLGAAIQAAGLSEYTMELAATAKDQAAAAEVAAIEAAEQKAAATEARQITNPRGKPL